MNEIQKRFVDRLDKCGEVNISYHDRELLDILKAYVAKSLIHNENYEVCIISRNDCYPTRCLVDDLVRILRTITPTEREWHNRVRCGRNNLRIFSPDSDFRGCRFDLLISMGPRTDILTEYRAHRPNCRFVLVYD